MIASEYDARDVANFILDRCERNGKSVTNMELQKILFFCHVWTLIERGRPLVRQKFEAWQHGPVLQHLYHAFKEFEAGPINGRAKKLDKATGKKLVTEYRFDPETNDLLERVVGIYSRLTASQLRNMSHVSGGPWDRAWNHGGRVNPGMKLENSAIVEFYSQNPPPLTMH